MDRIWNSLKMIGEFTPVEDYAKGLKPVEQAQFYKNYYAFIMTVFVNMLLYYFIWPVGLLLTLFLFYSYWKGKEIEEREKESKLDSRIGDN